MPSPPTPAPSVSRATRSSASLRRRFGVSAAVLAVLVAVVLSHSLHGLLAAGVALAEN